MPSSSLPAAPAAIDIHHLTKVFGDVRAVDDLSFSVSAGEIFGLVGPNGAGKTTTIQLLLGLTTPTSGDIRILGRPMPKERLAILQRVNFSSAYISLPSNLTVRQNLRVFAGLYGVRRPRLKIDELLALFEVEESADKLTGALSSGQLTRVNLCKALLNDPEILFLDEPTASLDPDIADKVRTSLQKLQRDRGVTIVYTSHNMREVEVLCDRVLFLARGRAVTEGTPREVIAHANSTSLEDVFIAIARDGNLSDVSAKEPQR